MSLGWNAASDVVIATCVKQVAFYSLLNGKLTAKNGSGWGVAQPADTVLAQATCGTTVFTAHLSGEIIAWNGSTVSKRNPGHKGKVNCLFANEAGTTLISGGADGLVSTWKVDGVNITKIKDFDLKAKELLSMNACATSVCESKNGELLLVATRGGEIYEFN